MTTVCERCAGILGYGFQRGRGQSFTTAKGQVESRLGEEGNGKQDKNAAGQFSEENRNWQPETDGVDVLWLDRYGGGSCPLRIERLCIGVFFDYRIKTPVDQLAMRVVFDTFCQNLDSQIVSFKRICEHDPGQVIVGIIFYDFK